MMHSMMSAARIALLALLACGTNSTPPIDASVETNPATWTIGVDGAHPGSVVSPAILGHYDLAGSLWQYDKVPGLVAAMKTVSFPEWRVSVERWEGRSEMFPTTTDGAPCTYPEPTALAASGTTDLDLVHARDWFIDDGKPVTVATTLDDSRYALAYARSVIDVANAFGAAPFVSIDAMPMALSRGKTFVRHSCYWSFLNGVTNEPPVDTAVFAAAATGLVQRIVLGSGGEPGRNVTHFEIWNEPEGDFWDKTMDPTYPSTGSIFYDMVQKTLTSLDAFRTSSNHAELRFGLAGFAGVAAALDAIPKLDAMNVPVDFISFHVYATDPIVIAQQVESVIAAIHTTAHLQNAEVALTEWGPGTDIENNDESRLNPDLAYAASIDPALHAATVLARGAAAGLAHAHHVFFWDFFPFRIRGLFQNDLATRPQYFAFQMVGDAIANQARVLPVTGASDTEVVLATEQQDGAHVLLVNRDAIGQTVRIVLSGAPAVPKRIRVYDDPAGAIREVAPAGDTFTVAASSIALVDL